MERTQLTASIAGLALIAASVIGAVVVTQGPGDVVVADTPSAAADAVLVSQSGSPALLDNTTSSISGDIEYEAAYDEAEHEEYEYEDDEAEHGDEYTESEAEHDDQYEEGEAEHEEGEAEHEEYEHDEDEDEDEYEDEDDDDDDDQYEEAEYDD